MKQSIVMLMEKQPVTCHTEHLYRRHVELFPCRESNPGRVGYVSVPCGLVVKICGFHPHGPDANKFTTRVTVTERSRQQLYSTQELQVHNQHVCHYLILVAKNVMPFNQFSASTNEADLSQQMQFKRRWDSVPARDIFECLLRIQHKGDRIHLPFCDIYGSHLSKSYVNVLVDKAFGVTSNEAMQKIQQFQRYSSLMTAPVITTFPETKIKRTTLGFTIR
ncbi:hypothetical protein M514_05051 [Trichuris suis]|uniref:Uncharacterized protein n=1 Tax=Trichuris suis TaxID=68888 RepID=A0A085NCU6_9BILA|nr:hypothetical protein M514_05051 [Trichuris suis]